jgi:hypothetical protein
MPISKLPWRCCPTDPRILDADGCEVAALVGDCDDASSMNEDDMKFIVKACNSFDTLRNAVLRALMAIQDHVQKNSADYWQMEINRLRSAADKSDGNWSAKLEGGPCVPEGIKDPGDDCAWVSPKLIEMLMKGQVTHLRVIERDGKKYLRLPG